MRSQSDDPEKGQSLIHVSIAMFLLLAIVALAVDVGYALSERRRMQNAADAGALAGAYELCFGDPSAWETTALDYALNRNGAETATATLADWIVTVNTQETVETYLAGIVGINTLDVGAVAEAACGNAISLCNIWPLTFHVERWERIGCGEEFYVFNDNKFDEDDPCYDTWDGECLSICDSEDEYGNPIPGACQCDLIPPDNEAYILGPGHRAWALFPRPQPPFDEVAPHCADNCGVQVRCWIESGAYDAKLAIGPTVEGICLPGQPGVSNDVRIEIGRNHIGETPNILIWDRQCTADEPVTGTCPGDPYHIVKTGCIEIVDVGTIDLMRKPEYTPPAQCEYNVKTILAKKLCDCGSECGTTVGGGPPSPDEVHAVSLIR